MNVHSVNYPVKILIRGQEVRKFPLFSWGLKGRRRKGTVGYNFGLDFEAQSFDTKLGAGHMDLSQEQVQEPRSCWLVQLSFSEYAHTLLTSLVALRSAG